MLNHFCIIFSAQCLGSLYCLLCLPNRYHCLKYMQETLHKHKCSNESIDNVEALEIGSRVVGVDKTIQKKDKLLLNWPLMSSIIIFCVFSLHDGAYHEVYSPVLNEAKNDLCISFLFLFSFFYLCTFK